MAGKLDILRDLYEHTMEIASDHAIMRRAMSEAFEETPDGKLRFRRVPEFKIRSPEEPPHG